MASELDDGGLASGGSRSRTTRSRPTATASTPSRRAYQAFISYSHAVDGELAPALQRALQGFAKPW